MKKFTFLLFIFFAPVLASAQVADSTTLTKVGSVCPSFSFLVDKGKTVNIADYRGKIVLINFFATWCPTLPRGTTPRTNRCMGKI